MNAQPKPNAPKAAVGLTVGESFYQVLEPAKVLGPNGEAQYAMFGPFADLVAASSYANTKPGAIITVTLLLHQVPAVAPPVSSLVKPAK